METSEKKEPTSPAVVRERIMRKVRIQADGCWTWVGAGAGSGYGIITVDGKDVNVRREMYRQTHGEPGERIVRSTCDNMSCVNPAHLVLGDRTKGGCPGPKKDRMKVPQRAARKLS